jgi:hypothetical protein
MEISKDLVKEMTLAGSVNTMNEGDAATFILFIHYIRIVYPYYLTQVAYRLT